MAMMDALEERARDVPTLDAVLAVLSSTSFTAHISQPREDASRTEIPSFGRARVNLGVASLIWTPDLRWSRVVKCEGPNRR